MGQTPDEIRQNIEVTRERMGETVEAIGYRADVPGRAKERVSGIKDRVVESVVGARDAVTGSVSDAGDNVTSSVSGAAARVGEMTPSRDDVARSAKRAVGVAQENPIGLAVGSIALGFLAGMLIPSTRIEDERLGPVAEQVKDKVRETGQEALDRGKEVAQQTAQAAQEAVQEAVPAVRDAAQSVADRTVETAKEQAQQQGEQLAQSAQQKASDVSAPTS